MGINDPDGKWDDEKDKKGSPDKWPDMNEGIQIMPSEPWGTVHELKPRMGWPEASAQICVSICVTVILVVLFMVLWGPW